MDLKDLIEGARNLQYEVALLSSNVMMQETTINVSVSDEYFEITIFYVPDKNKAEGKE